MENLIKEIEKIAKEKFDGHFSIFSFTTNYKGCFGTHDGDDFEDMKAHKTLKSLLKDMIKTPNKYSIYHNVDGSLKYIFDDFNPNNSDLVYFTDGLYVNRNGDIVDE